MSNFKTICKTLILALLMSTVVQAQSNPETINCGVDTVQYPLAKSSGWGMLQVRADGLEGLAQWYELEGTAQISGVTLYGKVHTTTGTNKTVQANIRLYSASNDSFPANLPLATATATFDTLFKPVRVPFLSTASVNGNYVITVEYGGGLFETDTLLIGTNQDGDGEGESLASAQKVVSGGTAVWLELENAISSGDRDILLHPWVNISLTTAFSLPADSVCVNEPILLTNNSSFFASHRMYNQRIHAPGIFGEAHEWMFGDGTVSSNMDPVHTYFNTGSFSVFLTERYSGYHLNCSEPASAGLQVEDRPVAGFTLASQNIALGDSVFITDMSSGSNNCSFDYGNGDTENGCGDRYYFYDTSGTFVITQIVTSPYGCQESYMQTITVSPTTSVVPESSNNLTVWPNPSTGRFHVSVENSTISNIFIFDYSGRLLEQISLSPIESKFDLDLSEKPEGVYLLKIQTGEEVRLARVQVIK